MIFSLWIKQTIPINPQYIFNISNKSNHVIFSLASLYFDQKNSKDMRVANTIVIPLQIFYI